MLRIFRGSSFRLPLWLAMSVDLCHHMLDLRVVGERVNGQVLAVAGLLEAAVRHLGDKRNVVVDPDGPELELPGRVQCATDVARPDRGREAVTDVVRPGDRLIVVVEALHAHDRAEDLALDDLGVLADVGDDGRLHEEAAVAVRVAAREDRGLRVLCPLQEAEHALLLVLRNHGSHLDVVPLGGIADVQGLDRGNELLDERVVDLRPSDDARGGGAVLTPSATAAGSASSKTTTGALPPSSRWTRLRLSAAVRAMALPVSTSPVRDTSRTSGCLTSASPTGTPSPVMTLRTPAGMTPSASSMKRSRLRGVCSEGFRICTLPAASAGANFQTAIISG